MDWLNFRHLYAFWMVARAESFTSAAKKMHVAQSAVSSQVAALEEYLGHTLIIRKSRSIELTPKAHKLMVYANNIFAHSREINSMFIDGKDFKSKLTLRIGIVGGISRNFVYRRLNQFIDINHKVNINVTTGSYNELYEMLKKFELDSIVSLELPRKKDLSEVSYKKLIESKMCIAATPELISNIQKNMQSSPIKVFKFTHPFEVNILEKYVQPKIKSDLMLSMNTDDISLLRFFANSGKGIAVLPKVGILEDLKAGLLGAIDINKCPEVIIYGISMIRNNFDGESASSTEQLWQK